MYIPYSFMWDGTRYVTLVGVEIDEYLQLTEVVNYKNAMPWSALHKGSTPATPNLEHQCGSKFTTVPIVNADSFVEEDGYYLIKGVKDGKTIELTKEGLFEDGALICGTGESTPIDEEVEPEPVKVEEPIPEDPVKEEEPVKKEPAKEEGNAYEVFVVAKTEEEQVQEDKPMQEEPTKEEPIQETVGINPAMNEDFCGFSAGTPLNQFNKETVLGTTSIDASLQIGVELHPEGAYEPPHKRRRDFGEVTQPAQPKTRYPWQHVEDVDEREVAKPKEPFTESGTPTVAPEPAPKSTEVDKAWEPLMEIRDNWSQSVELAPLLTEEKKDITPEAPTTVNEVNKELKEAFRSTLSPEVNAVIGDIPHSILGSIEAWSSNDIDMKQLEEQGDIYCIDHRWQKCGKWFCIDLISRYTRYFYNSKLGVSLEIPTSTCKEWLNIVSGNNQ